MEADSGWLDRWMFRSLVEKRLPLPDLDDQTAARAREIAENQPQGRYQHSTKSWIFAAGSAVLSALLIFLAIRTVKLKRLIEAVPTSSSRGLSFGLSELKGMVDVDEAHPPIRDPLKNEKCVAYDYKVEEREGGEKDDKWRTVEERSERVPFWLEDPHGKVLVHPEGATIEYPKFHRETRGDRRYTVRLLDTFVNVDCLGFAGLDKEQSDRLSIRQDNGSPFLISANEEEDIVLDRGARQYRHDPATAARSLAEPGKGGEGFHGP